MAEHNTPPLVHMHPSHHTWVIMHVHEQVTPLVIGSKQLVIPKHTAAPSEGQVSTTDMPTHACIHVHILTALHCSSLTTITTLRYRCCCNKYTVYITINELSAS